MTSADVERGGNFLNPIRGICEKPPAHISVNVKTDLVPSKLGIKLGFLLLPLLFNILPESEPVHKAEKGLKTCELGQGFGSEAAWEAGAAAHGGAEPPAGGGAVLGACPG